MFIKKEKTLAKLALGDSIWILKFKSITKSKVERENSATFLNTAF